MTAETIEINGLTITSKLQEILQYIGEDTDTYLNLIFHLEDILLAKANDNISTAVDCVEELMYLSYFRNLVLELRVKEEE
jgi:hypothetical protein